MIWVKTWELKTLIKWMLDQVILVDFSDYYPEQSSYLSDILVSNLTFILY